MKTMRSTSITSIATLLVLASLPSLAHGEEAQKGLIDQEGKSHESPIYPSRDAQISIFRDSKYPCVRERGKPVAEFDIPMNVCASANFTLDNNVHLEHPGLCSGGVKYPYISIYSTADCTGEHSHPDWYDRRFATVGPGHCLSQAVWGKEVLEAPEGQWSILFTCADNISEETSSPLMELSLPQPRPVAEKPKSGPSPATVSDSTCYFTSPGMNNSPEFRIQRPEPDTCVDFPANHMLKIYKNAVCSSGNDAVFVRYTGKGCKGTLVDWTLVDENLIEGGAETCIEMGGNQESSYTFMCNGDLMPDNPHGSAIMKDGEIQIQYSFGDTSMMSSATTDKVSLFMALGTMMLFLVLV